MSEVIRIPHGTVFIDDLSVRVRYNIPNPDDPEQFVAMALGYLDAMEAHEFNTDYVKMPIVVKRGLFSRDPGPLIARIERALNSALSQRGMYYDGYAMRRLQ